MNAEKGDNLDLSNRLSIEDFLLLDNVRDRFITSVNDFLDLATNRDGFPDIKPSKRFNLDTFYIFLLGKLKDIFNENDIEISHYPKLFVLKDKISGKILITYLSESYKGRNFSADSAFRIELLLSYFKKIGILVNNDKRWSKIIHNRSYEAPKVDEDE